jgi:membrane protein
MEDLETSPATVARARRAADKPTRLRLLLRTPAIFRRALVCAVEHDFLNLAQSSAYSAMFSIFPALIVAAAILSALPGAEPLRVQLGYFFADVLPPDVMPLLTGYFAISRGNGHSVRVLAIAAIVSFTGASGVMATLMEGLRRANELDRQVWSFAQRRARAFLLVPLALVPLALGSVLVVFGHWITITLAAQLLPEASPVFSFIAGALRLAVALVSVAASSAIVYHVGTPMRQRWHRTLPGAFVATLVWFVSTLVFGLYVTRFANYSVVYGSLGAGIALLIWLSIIFLSLLCGAEFNHQFDLHLDRTGARMERSGETFA